MFLCNFEAVIMSQLRKIKYRFFAWRSFPDLKPCIEPIDVVIPIIAKDLKILPLCLEGVRRCVMHPIQQIYIVAPKESPIVDFCREHELQFVDENSVFGFSPRSLNLQVHALDGRSPNRSGWLFQQLVKLSGKIGTCRRYLCIDADHILIRPHVFLTEAGKTVFYMSYEEHQPYYKNIQKLLPGLKLDTLSYVDHKMLFDKELLCDLHQALSQRFNMEWTDAIIQNYDLTEIAGFSEFEIYGNYVTNKERRPWLQKRLPYSKLADYDQLQLKWARSRCSLTFPDYMNQKND